MIIRSSRIAGLGHYAPERRVENAEIESSLGLEAGWIARRTGIHARRWAAPGETLTDMAVAAGSMALDHAGVDRASVALTLLATSTPDHLLPPSSPLLAYRLGLSNSGAIDLTGACSGFLYALVLADSFVRIHGKSVLVVAANILSRRINHEERASAVLFADAAGALLLSPCDDPSSGLLSAELVSEGKDYELISIPTGGSAQPFTADTNPASVLMTIRDGQAVFTKAVRMMCDSARIVLERSGIDSDKVDRFIPHQANARITTAVCDNLGIMFHKQVQTIDEYGNSSAATIPLSLSISHNRRPITLGENLLFATAGAGMAGGAALFRISAPLP